MAEIQSAFIFVSVIVFRKCSAGLHYFCDINVTLLNADINNAVMSCVAPPYLKAHFHEWKTLATKELKATIQLQELQLALVMVVIRCVLVFL